MWNCNFYAHFLYILNILGNALVSEKIPNIFIGCHTVFLSEVFAKLI